mmetsp:Transcript_10058/g.28856  ORF Transcript_10058/g.28856 Transcript_10058/m.28856 type:complete len:491 (-) Transcript_10058:509-1981(-)|eukprot:CAMPEP_0117667992 /NCGR_PEP_ID=MMETSP0804-20121206/11284_1 /TAXON_ID=1074897 /ORGANISM="Tetraselmis astigmatica, Strain CCMP880" /LENGTH=490 /DNA_ID=CAMNT_0005475799 /DNA_START=141 /DNA_END=1613 /DNA_ORIENTATION=+
MSTPTALSVLPGAGAACVRPKLEAAARGSRGLRARRPALIQRERVTRYTVRCPLYRASVAQRALAPDVGADPPAGRDKAVQDEPAEAAASEAALSEPETMSADGEAAEAERVEESYASADAPTTAQASDSQSTSDHVAPKPVRPPTSRSEAEKAADSKMESQKPRAGKQRSELPWYEIGDVIENIPFKKGDVVVGKVRSSNSKGARVEVLCDTPGIIGYMPLNAGPMNLNPDLDRGPFQVPYGLIREFVVMSLPEEVRENGVGPLLTAKNSDTGILWNRLEQMQKACNEHHVNYDMPTEHFLTGGLRCRIQGMLCFIPYNEMSKCRTAIRWDAEVAEEVLKGKSLTVALKDTVKEEMKVIGSVKIAMANTAAKTVRDGKLIHGTVRMIKPYGAFVGIDGTNLSALLHISNMSQAHVVDVQDVLKVGDRVSAVVNNDGGPEHINISLSVKELEQYPGEARDSMEHVMRNAQERYRDYVIASQHWEESPKAY